MVRSPAYSGDSLLRARFAAGSWLPCAECELEGAMAGKCRGEICLSGGPVGVVVVATGAAAMAADMVGAKACKVVCWRAGAWRRKGGLPAGTKKR